MKVVLLIEDNIALRENTTEILELAGYKIITAENGKQGVTAALTSMPDIIICDIMLPELDGYGVIHILQKNASTQNIPFIFLTAKTERGEVRKGMMLGADDYITKPFNGIELLDAIASRLHKSELLKKELNANKNSNNVIHTNPAPEEDLLQKLIEEGNINKFKKKQIIYSEGNQVVKLFYVQQGKIKTYKTNDDGKELITNIYYTGDFFGYVALLEQIAYKETAETLEDCSLILISKNSFEKIIYNNYSLLKKFVNLLAKNIIEKEEQLLGLAYNSLRKKVANALLSINNKYQEHKQIPVCIDISRSNLATIAGTAMESLIRTLSDFKNEKLIDIHKSGITVLNEKKLKNLIN